MLKCACACGNSEVKLVEVPPQLCQAARGPSGRGGEGEVGPSGQWAGERTKIVLTTGGGIGGSLKFEKETDR